MLAMDSASLLTSEEFCNPYVPLKIAAAKQRNPGNEHRKQKPSKVHQKSLTSRHNRQTDDVGNPFDVIASDVICENIARSLRSQQHGPEVAIAHGGTSVDVKLATDERVGDNRIDKEFIYCKDEKQQDVVKPGVTEAATLTDVCYCDDLPEVDLVSLIEEQIPRYVLRADTLTDFAGYENADWISTPVLPVDAEIPLSPELIDETLKYFVLCSDRVTQMTKAYNDIEAVTRLLEEKERDLELAARIGQTLLEKNKELAEQNELLEEQVSEVHERVSQLKHELSMKDALLQVYVNEYTDTESPSTPNDLRLHNGIVNWDSVQKKITVLEEENLNLKVESAQLKNETLNYEEKEQTLVNDACKHLAEINDQIRSLHDELGNKAEVNLRQQEEITAYMGRCMAVETRISKMTIENAELQSHLTAAQEAQRQLTTQVSEMSDKYHECLGLLHEAQEELKGLQRKERPSASRQHVSTFTPFLPEGSLAAELESTLKRDMAYPEGYSPADRKKKNKRIMETAKYIKRHAASRKTSGSMLSIPGSRDFSTSGNESCESICGSSNRSSLYISDTEGLSENFDSMYGSDLDLGRPGIPGSNDLETALKRLSMRKANEINEQLINDHHEHNLEEERRRREERESTPVGYRSECRSPDSIMSTGSASALSDLSRISGFSGFRLPEKLQIVKPIEGSATLHHWQRLATPHLGGFLDDRHGVHFRGQRQLPVEDDLYELSDYEEDDLDLPGVRQPLDVAPTFTYTTSRVLHPSDEYNITNIYQSRGPQLSIDASSTQRDGAAYNGAEPSNNAAGRPTSGAGAPTSMARTSGGASTTGPRAGRASTSTYSMSVGLARILRERGLNAACTSSKKRSGIISRYDANPLRFASIVTETMAEGSSSKTEVIYSSPSCSSTPINSGRPPGAHPSILPGNHPSLGLAGALSGVEPSPPPAHTTAAQTVLNLVDRIKNIGLGSVIGAVSPSDGGSNSGSGTVSPSSVRSGSLCSLEEEENNAGFSGLNSIMTMNNRRGLLTRGQAAQGVVPGGRRQPVPPSGYFCTRLAAAAPPSRPTTLALSRIISVPQPATTVKNIQPLPPPAVTDSSSLPFVSNNTSNNAPHNTAKDNRSTGFHYGGTMSSSSGAGGGVVMSSSRPSPKPMVSVSAGKPTVASGNETTGCIATSSSNVSDSLLKHLGSAHARSGATSGAALSQQKKKSGGQLL